MADVEMSQESSDKVRHELLIEYVNAYPNAYVRLSTGEYIGVHTRLFKFTLTDHILEQITKANFKVDTYNDKTIVLTLDTPLYDIAFTMLWHKLLHKGEADYKHIGIDRPMGDQYELLNSVKAHIVLLVMKLACDSDSDVKLLDKFTLDDSKTWTVLASYNVELTPKIKTYACNRIMGCTGRITLGYFPDVWNPIRAATESFGGVTIDEDPRYITNLLKMHRHYVHRTNTGSLYHFSRCCGGYTNLWLIPNPSDKAGKVWWEDAKITRINDNYQLVQKPDKTRHN